MIRQRIHIVIKGEPWYITIFLPITRWHIKEIMSALLSIDINEENYNATLENLTSGRVNNGITFTNPVLRESVTVFGFADSQASYFDLINHEIHHLSVQIAEAVGYDLTGEEVCYLQGGIAKSLYKLCRPLIT